MSDPAAAGQAEPQLPPELGVLDDEPSTQAIIAGRPGGHPTVGLLLKRTYRLTPRGGWEPVAEDEQEVVVEEELAYEPADPPFVSSISHGDDTLFRPRTDVVVQGSAWAPGAPARRLMVRFRMEDLGREIIVSGNRQVERGPGGELRFSEPEPFESIPIRYDRAYGGVDLRAWLLNRSPLEAEVQSAVPGLPLGSASRYHYPRNPAGVGFLIDAAPYDPADLLVPNLEYAHDPVTPDRLAVGAPERWPEAPLPAGMDWLSEAWFPRQELLGLPDLPAGFTGRLAERELGWVPADLADIGSVLEGHPVRPEYGQGASPGMTCALDLDRIRRGIPVELVHLHPEWPELRMELPREFPLARLGLGGPAMTDLAPTLFAIVIRPEQQEVVMTWCAVAARTREYTPGQYADMAAEVEWRRDPG